MKNVLCETLGVEFPLFAFSHCRDVVAEVTRAGGMGVLGIVSMSPEQLEAELSWIDERVDGKPYGVDLIVPSKFIGKSEGDGRAPDPARVLADLPEAHRAFAAELLKASGLDPDIPDADRIARMRSGANMTAEGAHAMMDVAFSHPIKLIANALGVPPKEMLDRGKAEGVPVAALVGTKEHAIRQASAGVDVIVAAGGEAGGHCGSISTMVLVPEVVEAMKDFGDRPVLAAGGIVTGRQMAAAMAMGAAGAWCGSVWLTTAEAETNAAVKAKMLTASSSDTVRSRARTGKHSRQLRSPWTDAWEREGAPDPLGMPLQSLISEPALARINKMADAGHEGAQALATYWVGQGVGLMNEAMTCRQVVEGFMEDFAGAHETLAACFD